MIIDLHNITCDACVLDKTSYLYATPNFISAYLKSSINDLLYLTIIIDGTLTLTDFNYVYIHELNAYYFVSRRKILENNRYQLELEKDVLFSNLTKIKNSRAYIKRSTSDGNKFIQDNLDCFSEKQTITYITPSMLTTTKNFTDIIGGDCNYLIAYFDGHMDDTDHYPESNTYTRPVNYNDGIVPYIAGNNLRNGYGTNTNYRLLNYTQLLFLARRVGNDSQLLSYIKGIYILPFSMSSNTSDYSKYPYITTTNVSFYLGQTLIDVNYDGDNTKVKAPYYYLTRAKTYDYKYEIANPSYEDYLKKYEIWCGFVGWVEIPPAQFINKRLYIYYHFDFENGSSTCNIYDFDSQTIIYTSTANMLTAISLSAENMRALEERKTALTLNTVIGGVSSALTIVGSAYTGNVLGVATGVVSASNVVANAVNGFSQLHATGSVKAIDAPSSNEFSYAHKIRITSRDVIKIDTAKYGLPCNKVDSLATKTGYLECIDFKLSDNSGLCKDEIDKIKLLIEKGIYMS